MSWSDMATYGRLFWLKGDGQRFRKVSRKLLVESAAGRILWCQRTVDIAVQGQETCDTSYRPQSRGDSIRHGERDPVATGFVFRGHRDDDTAFAEMACQISLEPFERMIADRFMDRPLDMESGEASCSFELLLRD